MSSYRHRDRYYSSSSSSDSGSDFDLFGSDSDDGITVVTVNGKRLTSDEASTRLGNIQIGSGRRLVVGGLPHRKHSHHRKYHKRKAENPTENRRHTIDPSLVASRKDFDIVASDIGKHWKKLARELGLSSGMIEAVSIDYHAEGTYEQAYQALRKWGQTNGNNARLEELVIALDSIGCEDIGFKLTKDRG